LLVGFSLLAAPRPVRAAIGPVQLRDCTEALLKSSSQLLKKRTSALLKCSSVLLECKLDDELGGGDFATCSTGAVASCTKQLDKLARSEDAARTKLAKACVALADYDFGTSVGLGLRRLVAECGTVNTEAEAYDCLVSRVQCRASDVAESVQPRTYELLAATTLAAAYPEVMSCLDSRAPVTPVAGNPELLADCQAGLAKALTKPFYKTPKDLSSCIGSLLACRLRADRQLLNSVQPPLCYAEQEPTKACDKAEAKLGDALSADLIADASAACTGVSAAEMLAALNFEAECSAAATVPDVLDCARDLLAGRVLELVDEAAPRTCQLSQDSGDGLFALGNFCSPECGNKVVEAGETCDDGNGADYDSCTNSCAAGPTARQSVSIPSPAQPAHTPDGTPGNAVAPGSSVAIQFGTTMPNLNNAAYVRYYAPAAGDPDAVLVLVPGFAGGAHSLKIVAETMVAKAAAAGSIVLEVWAFDRRTDQLEDDAGGELAESEDDPELAMNWYFGTELGLALDPRISRRAVFHQGSDIPFIANFTYNMFIRDIDTVIDAALALPSAPTVFLGGHSLGTLFSARYAATDLDPGVALVPGHDKVAGLVLFEGNGDSLPIAPPSSDALDTVIAKADGGLYHAIKNGGARCWDGTPCPGGDADCSVVALADGAVTNKCVLPVDAFAGGVISPEIHAVGDAVALQSRRFPDSMSIAQVDFGIGASTALVPGLSLLDLLPKSSAESSVGFFLDDDYSPEVSFQASMGFSDNGPNIDLVTFYLAGFADEDPYRLWKGIETPQAAAALIDHGVAGDPFALNGIEKEITPMGNVLTMVRTGDRNIGDWYFPASGLGVTFELIVGVGGFTGGLDSSALSIGRNRPDIENLTEGANIDIPIISFGGSNGISPTPGALLPFAESIATCTAPSCTGAARVLLSDPINPTYGDADGGFEAYVSEGYAHIDVVASEDDPSHNLVYAPLLAFLERNTP